MENPLPTPHNFITLLRNLPEETQFISLMDTDHGAEEIPYLYSHPDVLEALKNSYREQFLIEAQKELNHKDLWVANRLLPDVLLKSNYNPGNTEAGAVQLEKNASILNVIGHNFGLWAVDPYITESQHYREQKTKNLNLLEPEILESTNIETKCGEILESARMRTGKLPVGYQEIKDWHVAYRANDKHDEVIAQNILSRAQDDNVVIIYGAGHFVRPNDIDNHLPNNVTISIFPNEQSRLVGDEKDFRDANELPDYMYVISTDRVVKLEPGSKEAENYWARIPNRVTGTLPALTEQEHADCVARLPERLKPFAPVFEDVSTGELGGLPVRHIGGQPKAGQLERE